MMEDPSQLIAELENNLASLALEKENTVDNASFHEEFISFFPTDKGNQAENYSEELEENCFFKNIPKAFITGISLTELNMLYMNQSGSVGSFETEDSDLNNQCLMQSQNYAISFDSIIIGEEKRTMVVIRNIPSQYTPRALFEEISTKFYGTFNYFYLPYSKETKKNNGFALINFISAYHLIYFHDYYHRQHFNKHKDKRKLLIFFSKYNYFEGQIESGPQSTKNIVIPLKYFKLFKKIYLHSVCVIKEKNIYSDGYFIVKSLGKRLIC